METTASPAAAQMTGLAAPRPTTVSPNEPGAVAAAIAYDRAMIDRLEQFLGSLEDRLSPILRPQPPTEPALATSPGPADPQPPSAMASDLVNLGHRLEAIGDFVSRITYRIDL